MERHQFTILWLQITESVLKINGLTMESSVKLLGIEIDNKLNFEKHISNISKKASNQLNAIYRLQTFLGHKEKEVKTNTFVHSNFNYGCLIWHFSSEKSKDKVEVYVLGVLHKIGVLGVPLKIGVLGVLHETACLACFIECRG